MAFDDDLRDLLAPCTPGVAAIAMALTTTVRDLRPDLRARVQFGWKTINFNHPRAGYVCCVYPATGRALLIFQHGRELDHPRLVDDGKVKKVRWIEFWPGGEIDEDDIGLLLVEAIALRA